MRTNHRSRYVHKPLIPAWLKVLVVLFFFVGLYVSSRILIVWDKPNSESEARVAVTIPIGASFQAISDILADNELIRDPWVFQIFVKSKKLGNRLQAGDYIIQKNLTFDEVTQVLMSGKSKEIKVTIPEGSTNVQIDDILARKSLIEKGDFLECIATCNLGFQIESLEGYLFPSTYYVGVNTFKSKEFISRLYNTWKKQISSMRSDISPRSLDEVMIVASMIEREAFGDSFEEKTQISDVMWKRFDEGIPLGIDATTRYELNEWKRALYTQDFETNSPYNTRRVKGLPPTAISNPGLDSIKAAIYPVKTEYYYYLHDPTGQIHFGKTHDDHVANKRKYLY